MKKRGVDIVLLGLLSGLLSGLIPGFSPPANAQFFSWGQDPASLRWKQIHTTNFQLIFPENYTEQAAYLADVLEYTYELGSNTLGHRPRKVSVIIHNQTVIPNGFVSWAPARLEMFTNPPPNNDASDWLEGLAVHEFRHVVQIDKLNQGITRLLTLLLGEQATGVMVGLFYPLWLLEGDAVVAETALTHGGRGRVPAFEQGLRAQVLEKGIYSFDKALLGSFRDHVPNYYEMGYQLVAGSRVHHGADLWDKVMEYIARRPYMITPLNIALRRETGLNQGQLYLETFKALEDHWTRQLEAHDYTAHVVISPDNKLFTSYRELSFVDDSTFIALRTGLGDIPRVVMMDLTGKEQKLFTPGFFQVPFFSSNGRVVVWAEIRPDPRWEHRNWSEVHVFDMASGNKRKLTSKTRYFAPAISPDGSKVAVTEVTDQNHYAIVVIDAASGLPLDRFVTPGNDFLMMPSWHADGRHVFAIAVDEEGKRIVMTGGEPGGFRTLFHAGHTEISRPVYHAPGKVLFNAAFSGVDNVYALDLETQEVEMWVSSPFGALDAAVSTDGRHMLWSAYSSMGYRVAMADPDAITGVPVRQVEDHSVRWHEELAEQESGIIARSRVPRHDYLALPYYKVANLFNFHSWGPFSLDVGNVTAMPGFSLMSQNKLSTSVASLGYEYDINEELGKFFLQYAYYGWYPMLDLRAETGLRRSHFQRGESDPEPFLWREKTLRFGASLPLSFRKGPYFYGLNPSVRTSRIQAVSATDTPSFFNDNHMQTMEYRLTAYWQQRTVPRDLRSRWGQSVDMQYRHTPFAGDMGWIFAGRLNALFPGMARHHSLRLAASYQKRQPGARLTNTINYSFPGLISYPRGITGERDDQAVVLMADYALPLMHPDLNIPGIFYLKRLSATLFYDHAFLSNTLTNENQEPVSEKRELVTYGVELMGNLHPLRFFAPMNIGVRLSYRPDTDDYRLELLTSISL
jgi:hypothetical protein